MLTEFEHRHVQEHYPKIDPALVGKHLGTGIEKVAYAMREVAGVVGGATEGVRRGVLKLLRKDARRDPISMWVSPYFTASYDQAREDLDTCVEYFGGAVVVPQIIKSTRDKASYCMVQEHLDMQMLTPGVLEKHPYLLGDLQALLEQDRKLQSDKSRFFDFQGWDIWRVMFDQIAMGNVAVVSESGSEKLRLKIFDLTLMHTPELSFSGIVHAGGYFSNQRNNRRMLESAGRDPVA